MRKRPALDMSGWAADSQRVFAHSGASRCPVIRLAPVNMLDRRSPSGASWWDSGAMHDCQVK